MTIIPGNEKKNGWLRQKLGSARKSSDIRAGFVAYLIVRFLDLVDTPEADYWIKVGWDTLWFLLAGLRQ